MRPNFEIEGLAAKFLLEEGISLPLRLPGGKPVRWTLRISTLGNLIRMIEMYLKMDVRYDELKDYSYEQKLEFMLKHGKEVSRMVAYGLKCDRRTGRLLNRPLAWMLRNGMHPVALQEAWVMIVRTLSVVPFEDIIALVEAVNPLTPRLSHQEGKR